MIFEDSILAEHLFADLSYKEYISEHSIDKLVGINLDDYGDVEKKIIRDTFYSVSPNLETAYTPEMDDLCRLHYLINTRKVTTILEFGIGKSTIVFDDAIRKNKDNYYLELQGLRRSNLFECHSVDNYKKWIDEVKSKSNTQNVHYHFSKLDMGTFNGRICTFYQNMPNICPDFIYLDGPDQFSPEGDIRGITTNHPDRLPMAADLLSIEHFLLPGTLIVTDGRTANARFLKSNFQRNWIYCHDVNADQHYFELSEIPLGIYNKKQIELCLGEKYFTRLNQTKN